MLRTILFFTLLLFSIRLFAQDEFPLGYANRDGSRVISVIGRTANYPTYTDKVFYQSATGNSPSFTFPDYGSISFSMGGCVVGNKRMEWWVEYQVDGGSNRSSYTVNPETEFGTKTVNVMAKNYRKTSCTGGGETTYNTVTTLTIKFEKPEWIGLDEIKTVCNGLDKDFNLTDYFSVKDGVTFFLDGTPLTVLNPSDLAPGFHQLKATKQYDNGTYDSQYGSKPGLVEITFDFQVLESAIIQIDPYPTEICQNASIITLKATPRGGSWSGGGIDANGNFNPADASIGLNELSYRYNNPNGCVSEKKIDITVKLPTDVSVQDISVCSTDQPFELKVAQPGGGTYTGRGITNNIFDPSKALVGANPVKYTYIDPGGCTTVKDFYINILDAGSFKVGGDLILCTQSTEINLNEKENVYPSDGTIQWSGTGVIGGKYFDPAAAGVGLHTITGTLYVPTSGCTYTKTFVAKVVVGTAADAGVDIKICKNAADFKLNDGSPAGGTWSGDYVQGGIFGVTQAPVGDYFVYYTYNDGNCSTVDRKVVSVIAPPTVNAGLDLEVCYNGGKVKLPIASPSGGTWTADGAYLDAATGEIDPKKMKIGANVLKYTYADGICTVFDELVVTVPLPPVVEAGEDLTLCENANPLNLTGDPVGGTWSGTGVNGNRFYASQAGVGEFQITYTYQDPNTKCYNSDSKFIKVVTAPTVDAGNDIIVCKNQTDIRLTGATPLGGQWSGDYVENGTFKISEAPVGDYFAYYTYTEGSCVVSDKRAISVRAALLVNAGNDIQICLNGGKIKLVQGNPSGGTWAADGAYLDAATGEIDPQKMKIGENLLSYTITDGICSASDQLVATVMLPPVVEAGEDLTLCENANPLNLTGDPVGGTWSGTGVNGNRFYASQAGVGEFQITYTYQDPTTKCYNKDSKFIKVVAAPKVDAGAEIVACKNQGVIRLSGATPIGGQWSGEYVTGASFDVSAAPLGTHIVYYTYNDGNCTAVAQKIIQVIQAAPINAGQDMRVCVGDKQFSPPNATPIGGKWIASFYDVNTNTFDPSVMKIGENTAIYSYDDPSGCTVQDTLIITLNIKPVITGMRDFSACLNEPQIALQATPAGGIWEGKGISNNQGSFFQPQLAGIGAHTLTYTFQENSTGCATTDTVIATIQALPEITLPNDTAICIENGIFPLKGAPIGGKWEGSTAITGNNFDPATAGVGEHQLKYSFTDVSSGCTNTATFNITVRGLPGSINISGDTVACLNEIVTLKATAENVTNFNWYHLGDDVAFASGTTIQYTITKDEKILVKPKISNPGECTSEGRIFAIINNSPTGTIEYKGKDTLAFGSLVQVTSEIKKAEKYNWMFGDGGTSFQKDASHYYYKAGKYAITLETISNTGCKTNLKLDSIIILTEKGEVPDPDFGRGTGFDENPYKGKIYPTAFREKLTATLTLTAAQELTFSFYDQNGNVLKVIKKDGVPGTNKIVFSDLSFIRGNGVYIFIKVNSNEVKSSFKLFKL